MSGLVLPFRPVPVAQATDFADLLRSPVYETEDEGKRRDALIAASWVLVRADQDGEHWRCDPRRGGCGVRHSHFTKFCIPRPFKGLAQGLMVYWQNLGIANPADLSPAQRARVKDLAPVFGLDGKPMPTLASLHPEAARALGTREDDIDLGAWVLGTIDPISPLEASVYAERINYRAGRTVVRFP